MIYVRITARTYPASVEELVEPIPVVVRVSPVFGMTVESVYQYFNPEQFQIVEGKITSIVAPGGGGGTFEPITVPFTSVSSITYNHNLGRKVSVTIYDAAGNQMTGDVNTTSLNQTIVTFVSSRSGTLLII